MLKNNVLTEGLKILKVSGVTSEKIEKMISGKVMIGGKEIQRIFATKDNGVLVQLRPTDNDAGNVFTKLIEAYGSNVQELSF